MFRAPPSPPPVRLGSLVGSSPGSSDAASSGALDSLPHGGYTVTNIRIICGETHKAAYPAVFATTVAVPLLGAVVAVLLFSVGL